MMDDHSFWDDASSTDEANAGRASRALTVQQIEAWERQRGLKLPAILREAFLQQDGGTVRGQPIALQRLESLAPVEDGLLDYAELAKSDLGDVETGLDYGKMVHLGRDDDRGCTLLLYYGDNGPEGEPSVYGYWSDGDQIDRLADSVGGLLHAAPKSVSRRQGNE